MLKSFLTSTIRVIAKNSVTSTINFGGFVFGLICAVVIVLYVYKELSYDKFHRYAERIYRITHNEKAGEIPGTRHVATVGPPVGPAIKQNYSHIEDAVRFRHSPDRIMKVGDVQHYENQVYYVDPSVFKVFSFTLAKGDPATALSAPNRVVITRKIAQKYFGDTDPVGAIITLDNTTQLTVSGVLSEIPDNSHLKFDFLLPFEDFRVPFGYPVNLNSWGWISFHTYVLLKPGITKGEMEEQLVKLVKANWPEERAKKFRLELQPLTDIYLGEVKHEQIVAGNKTYLYVLSVGAFLILLLAGFNFANLYTVVSLSRAKEMGVRKLLGARKGVARYMAFEAVAIALLSGVVAIALFPWAADYFNALGFNLNFSTFDATFLMFVALVCCVVGLMASIYPASLMTSLGHDQLLRGTFRNSRHGLRVRRTLMLAQFCITIGLLTSVLIIDRQMSFIATTDLGYAKDHLVLLRIPGNQMNDKFPSLKAALLRHPEIEQVSVGGGRLDGDTGNVPIYVEGNLDEGIPMNIASASFDFFSTIGVNVIAGKEISEKAPADSLRGVLINKSALETWGWTAEQALGKKIRVGDIVLDGEIIGVLPDFNFGPLRDAVAPLVVYYPRTHVQDIYLRIAPRVDESALLASIAHEWRSLVPEYPFDYVFLRDHLGNLYQSEKFFALLFKLFAVAAIIISCLGLFALVSQDVLYRVKEIGIRKVLGAGTWRIAYLIARPFLLIILGANVIAAPLSWVYMNGWLSEFSYHTAISWTSFAAAGLSTLIVAMLTIAYRAITAGKADPVKLLRAE